MLHLKDTVTFYPNGQARDREAALWGNPEALDRYRLFRKTATPTLTDCGIARIVLSLTDPHFWNRDWGVAELHHHLMDRDQFGTFNDKQRLLFEQFIEVIWNPPIRVDSARDPRLGDGHYYTNVAIESTRLMLFRFFQLCGQSEERSLPVHAPLTAKLCEAAQELVTYLDKSDKAPELKNYLGRPVSLLPAELHLEDLSNLARVIYLGLLAYELAHAEHRVVADRSTIGLSLSIGELPNISPIFHKVIDSFLLHCYQPKKA
jgi:hypothetical protein